jgi:predicted dehydrogenase
MNAIREDVRVESHGQGAMRAPVRLALVGVGKIARDQHCPTLAADRRFQLAATVSHHGCVAEIPAFTDIAALLRAQCAVDAVSICTPPAHRYALASEALAAGLHVMLEKPPAATLSQVHDLEERARQAGLTLFTTWHSREAACVDEAREWLAMRTIKWVRVTWKEDIRRWHPGQHWILEPGGFGVFDPGINALSILCRVLPQSPLLHDATLHIPANRQAPIAAQIAMALPQGIRVDVTLDFLESGPQQWDIEIDTTDGRLLLSEGGQRLRIDGRLQSEGDHREYARLYSRFAELIAARTSEVDVAPLRIVCDAFLLGRRVSTASFEF